MGLLSRIGHGAMNWVTAGIRAAVMPFTFTAKMLGTGIDTVKKLAKFDLTGAAGTLIGGTVKNTVDAGLTVAGAAVPAVAFLDGFARDSVRYS